MRLLEPLQGFKMASGHYIYHFVCSFAMLWILLDKTRINSNLLIKVLGQEEVTKRELKNSLLFDTKFSDPAPKHKLLLEYGLDASEV